MGGDDDGCARRDWSGVAKLAQEALLWRDAIDRSAIDLSAIDEGHIDIGHQFEWISGRHDQRSGFAGIDGAESVTLSDDLRGIKSDRSKRNLSWKTMSRGSRRMVRKISDMSRSVSRGNAECDAGLMKPRWKLVW